MNKKINRLIHLVQTDQEYQVLATMILAMLLIPVFLFSLVLLSSGEKTDAKPKVHIPTTPVITELIYSPTPEPTLALELPPEMQ